MQRCGGGATEAQAEEARGVRRHAEVGSHPASPAALIAGALFATGALSLLGTGKPSTKEDAAVSPTPGTLTPGGVRVPFANGAPAPQYEDDLVAFSGAARPIVNEGPLPQAPQLPRLSPTPAPEPPLIATLAPMIEHAPARPRLRHIPGFWEAFNHKNLFLLRAPMAAAGLVAAAGTRGDDEARRAYAAAIGANGGFDYRDGDTNDFARGYRKICGQTGYRCAPQAGGMIIDAPDGTRIRHSYSRGRPLRNEIQLTTPDGLTHEMSHSPLVFALGRQGVRASDRLVRYDVDGRGLVALVHDIATDTAVLAFDAGHTGVPGENGWGLFGDGTDLDGDGLADGYRDGFEALEAFVRKAEREGVLAAGTLEAGQLDAEALAALQQRYGLSLRLGSLASRAVAPAEAGIREIALSRRASIRVDDFDGQGDDVVRRDGATFTRTDGSMGAYEDIFFRYARPALKVVRLEDAGGA